MTQGDNVLTEAELETILRILAVVVKEAPHTGKMKHERLDRGIVGIGPLDLAFGVRRAVEVGILERHSSGNVSVTDDGWAFLQDHHDRVETILRQLEEPEAARGFDE